MNLKTQVKEATQRLLTTDDPAMIQATLQTLHTLFADVTGIRGDEAQADPADRRLASGRAIGPNGAAACLLDFIRTTQFLRGTQAAIQTALHRFPQYPLHIVYAGCGPYATLLLPLTPLFSPQKIQITLIDIHEKNLISVQKLAAALGATDHIYAIHQLDATTYQHPANLPLHIVVSETMAYALQNEPHVAIMRHLRPQLTAGGFLIPQTITIRACLTDPVSENLYGRKKLDQYGIPVGANSHHPYRLPIDTVLNLNAETLQKMAQSTDQANYPLCTLTIPPHHKQLQQYLHLTHLQIFEQYTIKDYQSGLTHPRWVHELCGLASGSRIQLWYAFGQNPGIRQKILSS